MDRRDADEFCRLALSMAPSFGTLRELAEALSEELGEDITPGNLKERLRRYRERTPGVPLTAEVLGTGVGPEPAPPADFDDEPTQPGAHAWAAEREARLASDFDHLRPEDLEDDVAVANDGRLDRTWTRDKRQEYSRSMGEFAQALRSSGGDPDAMPEESGTYLGKLAEQERRFGNRRLARSVSLLAAHEALHLRQVKEMAEELFRDKITPTGYATQRATQEPRRTLVVLLSDLHIGAEMAARDNPVPFTELEERRRLEHLLRQILDYKPRHRDTTELVLVFAGDTIDGKLHDLQDGAPIVEQKLRFWHYFRPFVGLCSQQFPRTRVFAVPGNHGRDKVRHPGRATSSKWDGHEWEMLWCLSQMCSGLPNVSFTVPFMAAVMVPIYGWRFLASHGDAEFKLGHPLTKAVENRAELTRLSTDRVWGDSFHGFLGGHHHTPAHLPGPIQQVWNGMLVPPNGFARGIGAANNCGQYLFEVTPDYLLGDARYIAVGAEQDRDESLGSIITRLPMEAA